MRRSRITPQNISLPCVRCAPKLRFEKPRCRRSVERFCATNTLIAKVSAEVLVVQDVGHRALECGHIPGRHQYSKAPALEDLSRPSRTIEGNRRKAKTKRLDQDHRQSL